MGYAYIALAAVLWGLLGPVSKLAFQEGVAPLEVAFWRAVFGGVLFAVHISVTGAKHPERRHGLAVLFFGIIGIALFYSAYQFAVEQGGATLAAVLLYTAPAWVALMSVFLLSERITLLKLVAIGLTIVGVWQVALGGGTLQLTVGAVVWGLVAGLCYASYYPFSRHYFRQYQPAAIYAFALPIGALGLLPLVDFSAKSPLAWVALAWVAFASTYLAYLAYGRALQQLEATRASIVATLEPVVAGVVAYLWWSERFGVRGYLGAALVLAGVVLTILAPARKEEAVQP